MVPLERCLQVLRPLIADGDSASLDLAERAIDRYLEVHGETSAQFGALGLLDCELTAIDAVVEHEASAVYLLALFRYLDHTLDVLRGTSRPRSGPRLGPGSPEASTSS